MAATTTGIAIDDELLRRIDRNAAQAGLSRSAYVLQWLPEAQAFAHDGTPRRDGRSARKARAVRYEPVPAQ